MHWGQTTPWAVIPLGRLPSGRHPQADTTCAGTHSLGRHPPLGQTPLMGRHPPEETTLADTPDIWLCLHYLYYKIIM